LTDLERISVTPASDVLFQEADGEVVLLSLRTGEYFGLNSVGARIWSLLNARRSWRSITEELAAAYEVPEEQIIMDISHFVDELGGSGLVKVVPVAS
jgi:hypothetical protein